MTKAEKAKYDDVKEKTTEAVEKKNKENEEEIHLIPSCQRIDLSDDSSSDDTDTTSRM